MRKCRVCQHTIDDTCRICDHCGEDLVQGRRPTAIVESAPAGAPPTSRTCPFCAEEIQFAAIVCKHCRRDLPRIQTRSIQMLPSTAAPRWGRILLVVGGVLMFSIGLLYCGADHQRFLEFDAQRNAWHRKCDAYLKTPLTNPAAFACNQELNELTAYAKRQGW